MALPKLNPVPGKFGVFKFADAESKLAQYRQNKPDLFLDRIIVKGITGEVSGMAILRILDSHFNYQRK